MSTNSNKHTVWLVDDPQLFRAGFRTLLGRIPDIEVTFDASNGSEFLERLAHEQPEIVFLDIQMPNIDGIEATRRALSRYPDLKIIILSMFGEQEYYTELVDLGIKGFLLKSSDFKEVEMAIAAITSGDYYFSQELLQQMMFHKNPVARQTMGADELSKREKEILHEICNGLSSQAIAEKFFISKRTVEKHRANLMMKTGCPNTASLVVFAVKNNIFDI